MTLKKSVGCDFCWKSFNELKDTFLWTVNPLGGYGRDEVLICEPCAFSGEYPSIDERLSQFPEYTALKERENGQKV
jgi:hypothetical protein